jgi:asparagine synthase (glutamine-hydrolysing)
MNNIEVQFFHAEWIMLDAGSVIVWIRGWITKNEVFMDANSMAQELVGIINSHGALKEKIAECINEWRGNYAFCIILENEVVLCADIVRSIPLVYAKTNGNIYVSDSHEWICREMGSPCLDEASAEEYLVSGFVFGNNTLHVGVNGVQAGELVQVDVNNNNSLRFFSFNPDMFQDLNIRPEQKIYECIDCLLKRSIQRMIDSTKNVRRWVVPLSGGYDSRIVASYLKKAGIENVVCFTYGRAGNKESDISKQVADALGYEWHFVEYNRAAWTNLMADIRTAEYLKYACNGTSLPVLQDYLALAQLRELGIVAEGDVVVPGHTLDFIAGSHLNAEQVKYGEVTNRKAGQIVFDRHVVFWRDESREEAVRERILKMLIEKECSSVRGCTASGIAEWFDWQERQAKFIANNVRGYEFQGLRWRLPLWDRDLTELLRSVPYEYRIQRKLFKSAYEAILVPPQVKVIPLADLTVPNSPALNTKAYCSGASLLSAKLRSKMNKIQYLRLLKRICRYFVPPQTRDTDMAFEEYFVAKYSSVGDLLKLCPGIKWPKSLSAHFRWRTSWPVRRGGGESNALLAVYVLRHYLLLTVKGGK